MFMMKQRIGLLRALHRTIYTARDHAFQILNLKTFSDDEIEASFQYLRGKTDGNIDTIFLEDAIRKAASDYQYMNPDKVADILKLFPVVVSSKQ